MTTVDFKAEVEKRRDEMMADLYSLLEINSEGRCRASFWTWSCKSS